MQETGREREEPADLKMIKIIIIIKMTGGTPEVRSDKSLNLLTFDIKPIQWNSGPMD